MLTRDDALVLALTELRGALSGASAGAPDSVTPVLEALDSVHHLLQTRRVRPEQHAEVRREIDGALSGLSVLVADVKRARDEAGRALARARGRRRPAIGGPAGPRSRIDMHT